MWSWGQTKKSTWVTKRQGREKKKKEESGGHHSNQPFLIKMSLLIFINERIIIHHGVSLLF